MLGVVIPPNYTDTSSVTAAFPLVSSSYCFVPTVRILLGQECNSLLEPLIVQQGVYRVVSALELLVRKQRMDCPVAIRADKFRCFPASTLWNKVVLALVDHRSFTERAPIR